LIATAVCAVLIDSSGLVTPATPSPGASAPHRARACVIYSHGNAWDIMTSLPSRMQHFAKEFDVDVVIYDYIGYGLSSGSRPSERLCELSIEAVYKYVKDTLHYSAERIIVCGESIGSVATVHIAAVPVQYLGIMDKFVQDNLESRIDPPPEYRGRRVAAMPEKRVCSVILIAPVSSAGRFLAGKKGGWFLTIAGTAAKLLPDNTGLNNIGRMDSIPDCPMLIIHGDSDRVVPYQCGVDLHNAVRHRKDTLPMVTVPGGDHNDLWHPHHRDKYLYPAFRTLIDASAAFAEKLEQSRRP